LAFVVGCIPLVLASGSGAVSRRILGSVVVFGMLAATLVANFMTPALFVAIEKLAARARRWVRPRGDRGTEPERVAP
jgi:HAE1 family hydrophobic/amphiphilic exporter-1